MRLSDVSLELRKTKWDVDMEMGRMFLAARQAESPQHALALFYRMIALARFVREETGTNWIMAQRDEDGARFINDALFAAAAEEPLIGADGEWRFERQTFLDLVLHLAETDGHA
jgi:hypothetical protein